MGSFDGKAFGIEMVSIVKEYLAREMGSVTKRLDALEKRIDALPAPVDFADEIAALKSAVVSIEVPPAFEVPEIDFAPMIDEAVSRAVAALPAPQDGKSVTVDDVAPLIASEVEKCVSALPVAKDGVGLAGMLIDRAGNLVATMTDGGTKDLGPVVGKDADMATIEKTIADKVAAIPAPKDGLDGLGFDDMSATYDGEKTVTFSFTKGERVKEFSFVMPIVIDRGVFSNEKSYAPGDGVTWGGCFWIAQEETSEKPDTGKAWRLSVKKGRDGRDGVMKSETPVKVKI